ncbi:MAG TPA: NAD-dependent epimerase/dehydratase family protein [Aliidiomarina sp.]|nr:NAD-dependent epimerase/dehydratase family protein [Aliidiomarina sp.]
MAQVLWVGFGDIGQRTSSQLLNLGYKVTGARRSPTKPNSALVSNYVQGDAKNADAWRHWLTERPQIIILTLTPSEYSEDAYRASYLLPVQTMLSVLEQIEGYQPTIYFISSTSVYGDEEGNWVNEESVTKPDGFSGQTMLACEQLLRASSYAGAILRCSGIYGPGRLRMLNSVRSKNITLRNNWTNRVHSDDIARALVFLCGQPTTKMDVLLVTDDAPSLQTEVVTWLAAELSLDITDLITNAPPSKLGGKRISNKKLKSLGFTFSYPTFKHGYQALIDNK